MKKLIYPLLIAGISLFAGCTDDSDYGENYDINLPVSEITEFSPATEYVDGTVTLTGENMDMIESVSLGAIQCDILTQESGQLTFKVNRNAERAKITVKNKYGRKFDTSDYFEPRYFAAVVAKWPAELQMEQSFTLEGDNLDLLSSVYVDGHQVYAQGVATSDKAKYLLTGFTPSADKVLITITDKAGNTIESDPIVVAGAVIGDDTYKPTESLLLANWDDVIPTYDAGWGDTPFESGVNVAGVPQIFGNYYSVKATAGNGWDGCYQKIMLDNGGAGISFSEFHDPYITFMVNTNGKKGYFNPSINGADKHFTASPHYDDDYVIQTQGWEWRSYSLTDMGFDLTDIAAGDAIELWVRGGNVSASDAFEISIDQVMITDGYLNPVSVFDMEDNSKFTASGAQPITWDNGTGTTPINMDHYLTLKVPASSVTGAWDELASLAVNDPVNLSDGFANGIYVNFLLNTNGKSGYAQFLLDQGDSGTWSNFAGTVYGDDYMLAPTTSWEWRSYRLEDILDKASAIDFSNEFSLTIQFKSGNNGVADVEINMDYVFFSAVPMK